MLRNIACSNAICFQYAMWAVLFIRANRKNARISSCNTLPKFRRCDKTHYYFLSSIIKNLAISKFNNTVRMIQYIFAFPVRY